MKLWAEDDFYDNTQTTQPNDAIGISLERYEIGAPFLYRSLLPIHYSLYLILKVLKSRFGVLSKMAA